MNFRKIIRSTIILSLVCGLLLMCALAVLIVQPNKITVKNLSTENISHLVVSVGKKTCIFNDLNPNGEEACWLTYGGGDSHYEVSIELTKGDLLSGSGGYMTSGMVFKNTKVVFTKNMEVQVIDA